jgi:[ribosomal protein S18]-alanine N-acetyltransferase
MGLFANLFARGEPVLSEATSRDAAAIAALHAASFRRGWSEQEVEGLLTDRHVIAHRAMMGASMAAFIMSRLVEDEAEILSVAVAPARQGRGLARNLLNLHLRRLAGLGARAVFLEVDEHNSAAIRLYDRAGFREISRRPNYYPGAGGKAAAALVLRRDLV